MTRIPAKLGDAERREDELVSVTLLRAGWMKPVLLPRWVAAFIEETVGMLRESREQARRERLAQFRHWWAGWLSGAGAFATGIRPWLGVPLLVAGLVVMFWPQLKAKWQDWRER